MNAPAAMSEAQMALLIRNTEQAIQQDAHSLTFGSIFLPIILAALRRLSAPADSSPAVGEAVAYMWRSRLDGDLVARMVREMDPKNPPYPDHWELVGPLHEHPAPPAAPGEVSELPLKWRDQADRIINNAAELWSHQKTEIGALRQCADELESALSGRGGKGGSNGRG